MQKVVTWVLETKKTGPNNMREACITNHWNTIAEWLMNTNAMSSQMLVEKLFRTVEIGLLGELVTEENVDTGSVSYFTFTLLFNIILTNKKKIKKI